MLKFFKPLMGMLLHSHGATFFTYFQPPLYLIFNSSSSYQLIVTLSLIFLLPFTLISPLFSTLMSLFFYPFIFLYFGYSYSYSLVINLSAIPILILLL